MMTLRLGPGKVKPPRGMKPVECANYPSNIPHSIFFFLNCCPWASCPCARFRLALGFTLFLPRTKLSSDGPPASAGRGRVWRWLPPPPPLAGGMGWPLSDAWPELVALGGWEGGQPTVQSMFLLVAGAAHGPGCQTQKFSFRGQQSRQMCRTDANVIVPFWSKQSIFPRQEGDLGRHSLRDTPLGFSWHRWSIHSIGLQVTLVS